MTSMLQNQGVPRIDHSRIILHFDYDCFYASVFEAENPALKKLPLAVQQKQIVVTCNYEARRRGLRKLQLIREAKEICPEVVVVLGEDLTKFRDVSKTLYSFLRSLVWGDKAERLGFDEVFLDVTSMINYNVQWLEPKVSTCFFQLDKEDPTVGFEYDPNTYWGPTYPSQDDTPRSGHAYHLSDLGRRLVLASHLGNYLRKQLEEKFGYTSTVGISTSKLLSKLAGNVHKPQNQTTLKPPYQDDADQSDSYITQFMDGHEIGKIPGIGFKIAGRIRATVLGHRNDLEAYRELRDSDQVTVGDVRTFSGMGPLMLDKILSGSGWPRDIGYRIWELLHGVDRTEVATVRTTPTQISIEDTFRQLDTLDAVKREIFPLTCSLIRRMHTDLTEDVEVDDLEEESSNIPVRKRRWLAHPRTLRLSTRSRVSTSNYETTPASYNNRISRSCPAPQFMFSFNDSVDAIAERLVLECLLPTFRRLHSEKSGWKICLINVAVTNMVDTAGSTKNSAGRDIGKMFRSQDRALQESRVAAERNDTASKSASAGVRMDGLMDDDDEAWGHDEIDSTLQTDVFCTDCRICGVSIPHFAMQAHETYHTVSD